MGQEKTEALVIRGVDYSETSRIVTLITPDRGRVACIAKGARRKNSPLAAVLDTFNQVELIYFWKDGRSVQTLAEASLLHGFSGIKRDLERSAHGALPLELAAHVVHDNEPSEAFYGTLIQGLRLLETWPGSARLHCAWQLARLLTVAGFGPELGHCVHCGGEIGHNPGFDTRGGAVCERCPPSRRCTRAELDALRALFGAADACPGLDRDAVLFRMVCDYMTAQTEASYRSLRVLHDMFGG